MRYSEIQCKLKESKEYRKLCEQMHREAKDRLIGLKQPNPIDRTQMEDLDHAIKNARNRAAKSVRQREQICELIANVENRLDELKKIIPALLSACTQERIDVMPESLKSLEETDFPDLR